MVSRTAKLAAILLLAIMGVASVDARYKYPRYKPNYRKHYTSSTSIKSQGGATVQAMADPTYARAHTSQTVTAFGSKDFAGVITKNDNENMADGVSSASYDPTSAMSGGSAKGKAYNPYGYAEGSTITDGQAEINGPVSLELPTEAPAGSGAPATVSVDGRGEDSFQIGSFFANADGRMTAGSAGQASNTDVEGGSSIGSTSAFSRSFEFDGYESGRQGQDLQKKATYRIAKLTKNIPDILYTPHG